MAAVSTGIRRAGHPPPVHRDPPVEALPIQTYFQLLSRYRRTLALSLVIGLMAGLVAAQRSSEVWVSGASVVLPAMARDPQRALDKPVRPRMAVTLDSEVALLMSAEVLARAASRTGVSPKTLAEDVSVSAAPNSRVLRIQVRSEDGELARRLVDAVALSYLDTRQRLLQERRSQQSEVLRRRISALQAPELLTSQVLDAPARAPDLALESRGGARAGAPVLSVQLQRQALRKELSALESAGVTPGRVIRAGSPARRERAQNQVPIISWMVLALAGAGLVIAAGRRRRPMPHTGAEVGDLFAHQGIPVAVLDQRGEAHDPLEGWARLTDAAAGAVVAMVSVSPGSASVAVELLRHGLERRGRDVVALHKRQHEGADAYLTVRHHLDRGRQVICVGGEADGFASTMTATVTDRVVVVARPRDAAGERMQEVMVMLTRLGLDVIGIIVDERPAPGRRRTSPARQSDPWGLGLS